MIKNKYYIYCSFALMAAIWLLSSRHQTPIHLTGYWDKVVHFASWAFLTVLLSRGLRGGRGRLVAFTVAVAYGILDEFHQSFVPGREPSAADVLADSLGAAVGVWTAALRNRAVRSDP